MKGPDQTSTQSLIDKYYQEEQDRRLKEKTQADILVKAEPTDLAMINMIAKRFQKNREELIRDVLSSALIDLFARMEAGERKLLARDADENTRQLGREIAEENGIMDLDVPQSHWANIEKQLLKAEKKLQKEQEQQQALIEKAKQLVHQMEQEEARKKEAEQASSAAAAEQEVETSEDETQSDDNSVPFEQDTAPVSETPESEASDAEATEASAAEIDSEEDSADADKPASVF